MLLAAAQPPAQPVVQPPSGTAAVSNELPDGLTSREAEILTCSPAA
jgi:hypothetical protein